MNEFYHMLGDPAHWAFEILVTILFDGILAGLFYPILRNCWQGWRVAQDCADELAFTKMLRESAPKNTPTQTWNEVCCAMESRLPIPESKIDLCTGCGNVRVLPEEEKK